jgi:hypothetical protein
MTSIDTRIATSKLVPQLRARLKELQQKRPVELAAYKKAVSVWRSALVAWLRKEAPARVAEIQLERAGRRYGRYASFHGFFEDAPEPPEYPEPDEIRQLQALLKQLSIAQPKEVKISTDFVEKYFGQDEDTPTPTLTPRRGRRR